MKILVAGCSFATELTDIIKQKIPGSTVTNVSHCGVGNRFISDSVVVATSKEKFDLIYVSWTGLSRHDVLIDSANYRLFDDWVNRASIYNLKYISTGGVGSWDQLEHSFADMLFGGYHRFVDQEQLQFNSLTEMIKIQSYLGSLNVPHYFTSMINQLDASPDIMYEKTCEYGARRYPANACLVNAIDRQRWILDNNQGMHETTKQLDLLGPDDFHPSELGYKYWIDLFVDRLHKDKII